MIQFMFFCLSLCMEKDIYFGFSLSCFLLHTPLFSISLSPLALSLSLILLRDVSPCKEKKKKLWWKGEKHDQVPLRLSHSTLLAH